MPRNTGDVRSETTNATNAGSSIEGSPGALFDAHGDLRSAQDVKRQTTDEPSSPEEWLEAVAPEKLTAIDERLDELPGTRQELINRQVQKVIEEAEENDRNVTPRVGSGVEFTITEHQEPREDLGPSESDDEDTFTLYSTTERCPDCDEEVAANVEIRQLRAADESGTRVYKGECGCTWRGDD